MSSKSLSFAVHLLRVGFIAANADTSFTHDLGRIPQAVFVVLPDTKATRIFKGSVAWTATTLSLQSNVASVGVTVLLV